MAAQFCESCSCPFDAEDNFCRQCGEQVTPPGLPVVIQPNRSLLVRQDLPPVLVKTAAALAAGTALRIAGKVLVSALARRAAAAPTAVRPSHSGPEITITETVYIRRTRVRL